MKKIVLVSLGLGLLFSGCATDGAYSVGKKVYKGAKVVVKELPLKEKTMGKLSTVDKVATTYDKARTVVRGQTEKGKPSTVTTSLVVEP